MTTPVMTGLVSFAIAMTGLFLANMLLVMAIGEINRRTDEERHLSYFGFTPAKMLLILREYRCLYPDGRLVIYLVASFGLAAAGLVGALLCLRTTLR
jgi:hypothetical protein